MRKLFYIKIFLLISLILVSCGAPQRIVVSGNPGTSIYTPYKLELAKIGEDGKVKVVINGNTYYPFLLSKEADSDTYIPFGLDYKKHSYSGCKTAYWFSGLTCFTMVTLPIVMETQGRLNQLDHGYQYKYLPEHLTNEDMSFTHPKIEVVDFVASEIDKAETKNKQAEVVEKEKASSKSTKSFGSKSTKSFKDYSTVLAGEYVGNGTLSINGNVIEKYANIIVELHRIDNKKVAVQVGEANGVEFFGEASSYSVRKNSDGTFSLVHNDVSVATIKIDGNSKLVYLHPRVNIDGDMYTLKITANKK